jgi:protein-disulfide isomerase
MTDDNTINPTNEPAGSNRAAPRGSYKWLLIATFICSLAALGLSAASLNVTLRLRGNAPTQSIDLTGQMHAYIAAHPEVIVESVNNLESRRKEREAKEAVDQLGARNDEVFKDPAAPIVGNPQGDAILVEFFDYNCPYCRKAAPVVDQLIQADPGVKVLYKEFPILGPGSTFAARAALAAQRQDKYAVFHNALFAAHGPITEASTLDIAKSVGLDIGRLKTDMADPAIEAAISRNIALAEALRIAGTPTFVTSKGITPGQVGLDTLKQMIADARKG